MSTTLIRAICVAALGAIAGAACLALTFVQRPAFILEMDRDLPRNVSGIFPPEFIPRGESFAWTGKSARINLPGLDRRVPWLCTVRLRGARSAPLTLPIVELGVDGVPAATRETTNAFDDMTAPVPPSPTRAGVILTISVSDTFVPGPGDTRALGVQLDRVECRPEAGQVALPPPRAYVNGMLAGAIFGAAFGLIGITAGSAVGAVVLLTLAQALPLSGGPGPYVSYADRAPWLAFWIAATMLAVVTLFDRQRHERLRQTARFAIAFSAALLYLKLLGLLHPAKPLVDAVFQAHRLQWVLDGRYYFTQLMPSGVQFPYAIGLYVFAAPWSALTRDYVTLLRIVVCAVECVAGAALYPMIARTWGDRLAGAIAVALFAVVPTSYWVVGNANLTNAFGQSVALLAVALVVNGSRPGVAPRRVAAWTLVIALALLSHVSTFATLTFTLGVMAGLFWWLGGPALRGAARGVLVATTVAAVFSVAIYYGHFGEVYVNALKVRSTAAAVAAPPPQPESGPARPTAPPPMSAGTRLVRSSAVVAGAIGFPILTLALAGIWIVAARRPRDPVSLTLAAWGLAFLVFFGAALLRVDPQFQRYSLEFVQRVAYAASPAFVILASAAAAWGWRSGPAFRAAAAAILAIAMAIGFREWSAWW